MKHFEMYARDDIMALQGDQLFEYVNYMLSSGYSFDKLCQEKKLRNKTIRGRLKDQCGAVYNQKLKRYVKNEVETPLELNNDVIETQKETQKEVHEVQKGVQKVLQKETPIAQGNTTVIPGVLSVQDKDVINSLKEAILGLTSEISSLNITNPVTQHKEAKISVKNDSNEFQVLNLNGEVKGRPMKLYPEVLDRLDAFCDKHPQYSKQRVISTLLMEAMDKYE